jgi:phosphosulfolactate phosphohydrolase-like enzyme
MNKKIMDITLVQHLWLANNQDRIDQVQFLSIEYLWKQLDHKKRFSKNKLMKDMKWCVKQDSS